MSGLEWGLVTCPEDQHHGAVLTGTSQQIVAARDGCTACRITLTCPCGYRSRHKHIWAARNFDALHAQQCPQASP